MSESAKINKEALAGWVDENYDELVEESSFEPGDLEIRSSDAIRGFTFSTGQQSQTNLADVQQPKTRSVFYDRLIGTSFYDGQSFIEYMADSEVQRLCGQGDSGVFKKTLNPGRLDKQSPDDGIIAYIYTIKYSAFLEGMIDPFDSCPKSSRFGSSDLYRFVMFVKNPQQSVCSLISGLAVGVNSMKIDEDAEILLSPEYFYGSSGAPPLIPPESWALYSVKLVKCQPIYDKFALLAMCPPNDLPIIVEDYTTNEIMDTASALHALGNESFAKNNFVEARIRYRRAVRLIELNQTAEDSESYQEDCLFKLYCNLSLVNLKLDYTPTALTFAKMALNMQPKNSKALYRTSAAYRKLGKRQAADRYLKMSNEALARENNVPLNNLTLK